MSSILFSLSSTSDINALHIFQKMSAVSYIRMRQTCKKMNAFAENNGKYVKIVLFRIDINPKLPCPGGFSSEEEQLWRWARVSSSLL